MFFQAPPQLGPQYEQDRLLGEWVARVLPPEVRSAEVERFSHLGALGGGALYRAQLEDRTIEPVHTPFDPWGHRIDRIDDTPLWRQARILACEHGLVAAGYAGRHGRFDRVVQFVRNYLVQPSLDVYACPLAMSDGACRTLLDHGGPFADRAVPRLTSMNPQTVWTSGQWMTERTGGSDVGRSQTEARPTADEAAFTLHGTKWFTSAIGADMALTLARPAGNPEGSRGLALFAVELRDEAGRLNGITVHRLKDKLGTRKVPTAELELDGCVATLVAGRTDGVKNIASMLNVTRTWNAVSAAGFARRAVALARDYAQRRVAFGAPLAEKPLHLDTLAGLVADAEATFHLAFFAVELLGRVEHQDEAAAALARVVVPIAKLTTARIAVAVCSEALEAFGGAGYVEDTGLPMLLRDAQVLPIWEGTTNVLSLDTLRALSVRGAGAALLEQVAELAAVRDGRLEAPAALAMRGAESAATWFSRARDHQAAAEAGARRFALTLGRSLALALMVHHAQHQLDAGDGRHALAAARRFARHRVDLVDFEVDDEDSRLLGADR